MEQQGSSSGARVDLDGEQAGARYFVGAPPERQRSRNPGAVIAIAGIGVLSFGFIAASILLRGGMAVLPGWSATFTGGNYRVTEVDRAAAAAGLRPGDEIQTVAGDKQAGFYGPALALSRVPAAGWYAITVLRAGRIETVSLRLPGEPGSWKQLVPNLIVCALLYALAFWIGSVKFRDITGRLATLTFLLTVLTFLSVVLERFPGWNGPTSALALAVANIARPLNLAVAYHFFCRFPQPLPDSVRGIALRRTLYAFAVLLWLPLNLPALAHILGAAPGPMLALLAAFRPDGRPGGLLIPAYETLATVLMGLVLARNYGRSGDPDSRRRLRWAGLGFGATLSIFLVFALLKTLWFATGSLVIGWLVKVSNDLATVVIALSCVALAYAVARHRVLGIHVVIRRGVQYLLAKNALQLIIVLPALIFLFEVIRHPDQRVRDLLLHRPWPFYVVITVTGAISLRYRRQMRSWLDRKFFLPQLEQERVLLALVERIRTAESGAEICLSAAREIDAALHVTGLHILLRGENDGRLRVAYSRMPDTAVRLRDWLNQSGSEFLRNGSIFSLYASEGSGTADLPQAPVPAEHVVVPLMATDHAEVGALVLGPKRSEQPYTSRDRDLLKAVAGQIALLYEVLRLKESVQQEKRVRVQVLGHLDDRFVQLLNECPDCGRCYTTSQLTCPLDGANLTLTLPVEKTIDGKYRLDRRIGRGGMGVVYEAGDLRLGRTVAIKMMVGDLFGNSQAMARFEREARAAAALSHPNVVRVYDFGRLAAGGAYLVMELVGGASWRERLRGGRKITLAQVSSWMKQLCSAMEAAHAKGIVHRDLKPENIMIADEDPTGRVIILDFGLAKLRSEYTDRDLTLSGAVMGTRGYMSPEQRAGRKVDGRSDVFALAVICVETLTGCRPPRAGASSQWLDASFRRTGPGWAGLARSLECGLAVQPARRPTVAEFWRTLSSALSEAAVQPGAAVAPDDVETLSMRRGPEQDQ
ncbi:MAG: protein kinase [Candidatus Sulfopaludibacter sp.]|nr:protein kinase [Candidatus Sulfopaludibacter sp.]